MSTDQPAGQPTPARRGIRRVALQRTETYLNLAGSDEVERLGSALESASLSPSPNFKAKPANTQPRAGENENAPPSSPSVRLVQRQNTSVYLYGAPSSSEENAPLPLSTPPAPVASPKYPPQTPAPTPRAESENATPSTTFRLQRNDTSLYLYGSSSQESVRSPSSSTPPAPAPVTPAPTPSSTDQPTAGGGIQPARRGIRRVPLQRTETYLNVAGSDEVERLGSALESASLSPSPKAKPASAQPRESENAPPPSTSVRLVQRRHTSVYLYGASTSEENAPLPLSTPPAPLAPPRCPAETPAPTTPSSTDQPTPARRGIRRVALQRTETYLNVGPFGEIERLGSALEHASLSPNAKAKPAQPRADSENTPPPPSTAGARREGDWVWVGRDVEAVGGCGEDDEEDMLDWEVNARRCLANLKRRQARANELALASSPPATEKQPPADISSPKAKSLALTRENLTSLNNSPVDISPKPKPKPLALTKQNLTLHNDLNASQLQVPFPTLPASPPPRNVAKKKTRPRSLERKPAFRNIHDAAASTSSVVEITMNDQPEVWSPSLRRSERRPLRREDTQILIIAAPDEQAAEPSSPAPGSDDSSLQPPPTPTRLRPRKPLPTNSKARARAQRALSLEHCQHGTLHIQYQWYEKATLPKGKKGYFVPVGGAMQQYKPFRKILVTPETLVGFKGLKSVHADAYAAKGEDGKRVYPDGVYVEEKNTLKQELDEGDKDEKGRECVTITVRPNVFVTAVIGGEAKDVLVDCVSFGSDMIKASQSVRADQLLVHMTKEHMEERSRKSLKRPLKDEVEVVWPEEERRRPAKRTRYAGILKVVNLETREVTLDRMVEVDK